MFDKNIKGLSLVLLFAFILSATTAFAQPTLTEVTVIGQVESLFNDRLGLKILHVVNGLENSDAIATGSLVSFDLPNDFDKGRRNNRIKYGSVIEVELIGNTATEYELTTDGTKEAVQKAKNAVLLWTAQAVKIVKNANIYLPEDGKAGNKKRKNTKKKSEDPLKIWTQEETVRATVFVKNNGVYLKEDRLGRRDMGLEVVSDEWKEKLSQFPGNKIVIHGITHRTSVSSGTVEIGNVMKIYNK